MQIQLKHQLRLDLAEYFSPGQPVSIALNLNQVSACLVAVVCLDELQFVNGAVANGLSNRVI